MVAVKAAGAVVRLENEKPRGDGTVMRKVENERGMSRKGRAVVGGVAAEGLVTTMWPKGEEER